MVAPGARPQTHIAEERIGIKLITRTVGDTFEIISKRFHIDYVFDNHGGAAEWVIGFPVVVPSLATPDGQPLSGFSVHGDGVGEPVEPQPTTFSRWTDRAVLHWCERQAVRYLKQRMARGDRNAYQFDRSTIQARRYEHGMEVEGDREIVGWYFWRQRFATGRTRLRVAYTLTGGGQCQTNFILRTARAWGNGRIAKLAVTLTLDDPARLRRFRALMGTVPQLMRERLNPRGQMPAKPLRIEPASGRAHWEWSDFTADRDFVLLNEPCGEG